MANTSDDSTACSICLDAFTSKVPSRGALVVCQQGHVVCEGCVTEKLKDGAWLCPECRQPRLKKLIPIRIAGDLSDLLELKTNEAKLEKIIADGAESRVQQLLRQVQSLQQSLQLAEAKWKTSQLEHVGSTILKRKTSEDGCAAVVDARSSAIVALCDTDEKLASPAAKRNRDARAMKSVPTRLFLVGGEAESGQLKYVHVFDFREQVWIRPCNDLSDPPRSSVALSTLDGRLYAFGGYGKAFLANAEMYDGGAAQSSWNSLTPMSTARSGAASVAFKNRLFVLGGNGRSGRLSSVVSFDPFSLEWEKKKRMSMARAFFGVGVLGDDLYAVGGYFDAPVNSVEKYDSEMDEWSAVAPMLSKRYGHCVAVCGEELYAIGGDDEHGYLRSVEAYVPTKGWRRVADMPIDRYGAGAVVYDGRIFVVGGRDRPGHFVDSIDVFDPVKNKWTTSGIRMPLACAWAGVGLL